MPSLLCDMNSNCQSISLDEVFSDAIGLRSIKNLILISLSHNLANGTNRARPRFIIYIIFNFYFYFLSIQLNRYQVEVAQGSHQPQMGGEC